MRFALIQIQARQTQRKIKKKINITYYRNLTLKITY